MSKYTVRQDNGPEETEQAFRMRDSWDDPSPVNVKSLCISDEPRKLCSIIIEEEGQGDSIPSSRTMPVPDHMARRSDGHQGAPSDPFSQAPPPTYEEAIGGHIEREAEEGATGGTDSNESELSPEEIAIVLKMQSDRDKYLPESRSSYAEAVEMISPEEKEDQVIREEEEQRVSSWQPEPQTDGRGEQPRALMPYPDKTAPKKLSNQGSQYLAPAPHVLEEGRAESERTRRSDFKCSSCGPLNSPITWLGRKVQEQSDQRLVLITILVVVFIGLALFLGLFPASFVYIEYHQIALPKSKMTGVVDRDSVYYSGCYVLGPDTTLVRFPSTAQTITEEIRVFTTDTIAITIRYSLVYFIRPKEVGQLFTKFMHDYDGPFRLMASSSIRNLAATNITVDQFRFNRTYVESRMHALVRYKLGGNCCPECCPRGCQSNRYCDSCWSTGCDQGYHVDVRHFNLLSVTIPNEVFERYLRFTILEIEKEKEFFLQDHALIEKETKQLTQQYVNEANEIISNGSFEARKVNSFAEAEKENIVQKSYIQALHDFFTTLKLSVPEHKSSLMMIRAIEDNIGNMYQGYGFNTSILFGH